MMSTEEPLSRKECAALLDLVSWQAALTHPRMSSSFVAATALTGLAFRYLQHRIHLSGAYWLLPTLILGTLQYLHSEQWTGGRAFRECVRRDLLHGRALVTGIRVLDAIHVEEGEDEGPTDFLFDESHGTFIFSGRFMTR